MYARSELMKYSAASTTTTVAAGANDRLESSKRAVFLGVHHDKANAALRVRAPPLGRVHMPLHLKSRKGDGTSEDTRVHSGW